MESFGLVMVILEIAGLTNVKMDFDGLRSLAVCSSKSMGSDELLEEEVE